MIWDTKEIIMNFVYHQKCEFTQTKHRKIQLLMSHQLDTYLLTRITPYSWNNN